MNWSETVWCEIAPIYDAILQLPFIKELAQGTLAHERFLYYIRQDRLYIENYTRVLAHIASRLPRAAWTEDFLKFASDGVLVEKTMHAAFTGIWDANIEPSPTCLLYTSFESAQATAPVEVEAAAVLPCFWVYQRVGEAIHKAAVPNNSYRQWIDTYADESFARATARAIEICDALAAAASPQIQSQMTRAFITATKMEWMFWDSAYNMEQWKI